MIFCFKTAHITTPIRTLFAKYTCTIPQNNNGTVMEDTLTNWILANGGTAGQLNCFISMPLLDAISEQLYFFSRKIACPINFEFENLPFVIAMEASPWCVFSPSKFARSWSVLLPTNCRKEVSHGQMTSSVASYITIFCLYLIT